MGRALVWVVDMELQDKTLGALVGMQNSSRRSLPTGAQDAYESMRRVQWDTGHVLLAARRQRKKQIPKGNDRKKSKGKGKYRSRSLRDDSQKGKNNCKGKTDSNDNDKGKNKGNGKGKATATATTVVLRFAPG